MIRNLSSSCPILFDIGANVGVWTVALASAHPHAHVYAFEPDPPTFRLLQNNVSLNRLENVTAEQLAISDSNGIVEFQVTEKDSIFNRLQPAVASAEDLHRGRFTGGRVLKVESISLDDLCHDKGIDRIGFLKLDVEGAEVSALKGAQRLLRNKAIDLIWIEVEPDNLREMGTSLDELVSLVGRVGYTFHLLGPDGSPGPSVDAFHQHSNNMILRPA